LIKVPNPTVWVSDNFAQDWFADALTEARGSGIHAIRREIIFACCFAESFIFEWSQRLLQIEEIERFFPTKRGTPPNPRYRRELVEKWTRLPKELCDAGKTTRVPKLDLTDLRKLVRYRNGLIHAAASRPKTEVQPLETVPVPTKEDLARITPGWAVGLVEKLVRDLHSELNVAPPPYLTRP
jgi:hypothetical protein